MAWQPTRFQRFERCFESSTGPALVVTDAGRAYVKAMGNAEGPHVLACEWVAAHLARWLGLRTFDFALLNLTPDDEVPLGHRKRAEPGPAFATRAEKGNPWGGAAAELDRLTNKADLSRLIVFDTWIRNRDRYRPGRRRHVDNVFLSAEHTTGTARELVTMDHTHCLADGIELTPRLAHMTSIRDETVYGAFPEFAAHWRADTTQHALARLGGIHREQFASIIAGIPADWQVNEDTRVALSGFLTGRAAWLAERPADLFRPLTSP